MIHMSSIFESKKLNAVWRKLELEPRGSFSAVQAELNSVGLRIRAASRLLCSGQERSSRNPAKDPARLALQS